VKLPTFSDLSSAECEWIDQQIEAARIFVSEFSPGDAWNPIRLEALDRAFGNWLDTQPKEGSDINGAINAVGIAFGSLLVAQQGFNWTIASDDQGTDLAVRALPNRGDVVVFPANFVAKRWDRKERDFLVHGFQEVSNYKDKLKAEWEAKG
jgi:hypothetical protein